MSNGRDVARPPAGNIVLTSRWEPEDEAFWNETGKRRAFRNLWLSIPCLLCAFSVWMYWSIIIVQMDNLKFPFSKDQLYTLTAIAGLLGATLRIPNSFFIALCGGRNTIAVTTSLLILPALGAGIALQDKTTPYSVFALLAGLSGIGGGAFASSMSNISFFFPKRMQGLALGLNAGFGNIGVSLMQVMLPYVMTFGLFGALGGDGLTAGLAPTDKLVWIQNCGLVWVPILLTLTVLAWLIMENLPIHRIASTSGAITNLLWISFLGLVSGGMGGYLLIGAKWNMWVVLPVTVVLTLLLMRYLTPAQVRGKLSDQFVIFGKKHNWVMTWLYTMTFGSFIGYSAAFPKLIQDVFGYLPDGAVNPVAPNPLSYAWLGPLVGSIIRPIGGWLSDKWGGARVTQWTTVAMIASALGAAYYIKLAGHAPNPETYFMPFLLLFLLLFVTTGVGNGSTFRMIPMIFEARLAGPILGWTSAVAAYGAFIIPKVFGGQIQNKTPEYALYGFSIYYMTCLIVNWWFYARKNAEIPC